MKYDGKTALPVILRAADDYEKNLRDYNLLFVCCDKHNRIYSIEVEFNASNFLHLTGVELTENFMKSVTVGREGNKSSFANKFYEKCINKRLSIRDFKLSKDGTTQLKLEILPRLMKKDLSANAIGDFGTYHIKLYTEKIVGSSNGCMGFVFDNKVKKSVPNTVLKVDIRNISSETRRILITYRKKKCEKDYSEIVHIANKVDWEKIKLPEELSHLHLPNFEKNDNKTEN